MEKIGKAARRLLQELDARVADGKTSSERSQKGSDESKKPERSAGARRPGSCASRGGVAGGLGLEPEARAVKADEVAPGNRRTLLRGNVLRIEFKRGEGAGKGFAARAAGIVVPFPAARQVRPGVVW